MFGLRLVKIVGESMAPALQPGSYALFRRSADVAAGDIVLAAHKKYGWIVKAVARADARNVDLMGLNAASTSRTDLGQTARERIYGRLLWPRATPGRSRRSGGPAAP
ncbi:MAG: S24/S26 family peptidase [Pseudomonadota bacterium]